ncbi:hypothetical protein OBBRIDRAFT_385901 [Obba rivulosa]|uniref:Uncharacterized protein n=1 Tax=Obba rivulosa TaxID=1052685 RepID=A0A8E2B2R5_9APHY|nr:hypothetical protein OBBRIDRAFT_385901 [Obba rivulosa]
MFTRPAVVDRRRSCQVPSTQVRLHDVDIKDSAAVPPLEICSFSGVLPQPASENRLSRLLQTDEKLVEHVTCGATVLFSPLVTSHVQTEEPCQTALDESLCVIVVAWHNYEDSAISHIRSTGFRWTLIAVSVDGRGLPSRWIRTVASALVRCDGTVF